MKHKAGLHKRVSSIFEDLNVADQMGNAHQADAPADAGAALSVEHHDSQGPATGSSLQPQSWQIDEPTAEPVVEEATEARQVKVVERGPATSKGESTRKRVRVAMMMIILLATWLVIVGVNMFGRIGPTLSAGTQNGSADQTFAFEQETVAIDWQVPRKLPQPIRDIMSPYAEAVIAQRVQLERLVVRGILYSADQPLAIIGTQIAQVGDEIMGARIIGITRHAVEFEKEERKWMQNVKVEDVP